MIFRIVQFGMWIVRTWWLYRMLDQYCHFQLSGWKSAFFLLLNGCFSLNIWTIHHVPLWIAWIAQILVDVLLIPDARPARNLKQNAGRYLIWTVVLESCWLVGWVLFSPLTEQFSMLEGSALSAVLGMILSMAAATGLFRLVSLVKMPVLSVQSSCILIFASLLNVYAAELYSRNPTLENWFLCLLIGISAGICGSLLQKTFQKQDLEREQRSLEKAAESLIVQQQKVEENSQSLREVRHALKDHLLILQSLNQSGQTEEIDRYLSELTGQVSVKSFSAFCQDPVVNALLNQVQEQRKDIHFDLIVDPSLQKLPFEADEILFLAINNACEELDRNPSLARLIEVRIQPAGLQLVCQVQNPLSFHKTFQSEKSDEDHGIGLRRMHRLADSLDGKLLIEQNEVFSLRLSFPKSRCSFFPDKESVSADSSLKMQSE